MLTLILQVPTKVGTDTIDTGIAATADNNTAGTGATGVNKARHWQ